jgi:hypothetical protein
MSVQFAGEALVCAVSTLKLVKYVANVSILQTHQFVLNVEKEPKLKI